MKNKETIMEQLREPLKESRAIIAAEVGCGLTAKCCDIGGADILAVTSVGKMRMSGRAGVGGYFAFGDAAKIVDTMTRRIRPVVERAPILVGVPAANPQMNIREYVLMMRERGFDGVVNSPSIGIWHESDIKNFDNIKAGFSREMELIHTANSLGMVSAAICRNMAQIERMLTVRPDILIVNFGFTGDSQCPFENAVLTAERAVDRVGREAPDTLILCNGGALTDKEQVRKLLGQVRGLHGFYGTSVIETQSVFEAISENVRAFKGVSCR
ncbi:MAG: phosphoenolpyruvate hydrolase family protein [Oscillospiraceae bacterium]